MPRPTVLGGGGNGNATIPQIIVFFFQFLNSDFGQHRCSIAINGSSNQCGGEGE